MKKIPLTGKNGLGKFALVDDEDFDWLVCLGLWFSDIENFVKTRHNNRLVKMHRIIMNSPSGKEVDHKNGNRLDNRKSNLRICEGWQNCANRVHDSRVNRHGYKGVYKRDNKVSPLIWRAKIRVQQKYKHLGVFKTKEEAAHAYNQAAIKHFGEFARLNSI